MSSRGEFNVLIIYYGTAITPYLDIAKQFRIGRQEDSHEFARYLVDALQRSCLIGYDR
jgi:ubiquitin carboxyl-terminal hydrolase 36/42